MKNNNLKIFCVTNKELAFLEKTKYQLAGVGKHDFSNNYIKSNTKNNIFHKEQYYSELVFHYWFWKNSLKDFSDDTWIGFCQKRRFWLSNTNKNITDEDNLIDNLLQETPLAWSNFDSILCEPISVQNPKRMKVIKRGWKNILRDPQILFTKEKHTIELHFDMHHGYRILDRAISVMNVKDKDDFKKFVSTSSIFNPHIMFITKKKIMNLWFEDLFSWLFDCEKIFGFSGLKGYDQQRLYAYLAERYLSFWFTKYTKTKEWPWVFFDPLIK
jgi:hypothetical protein